MLRKSILFVVLFQFFSCGELQDVVNKIPQGTSELGNAEVAKGLREALELGIEKQVSKLSQVDGYLKNELVKILLPKELQKVNKTLQNIGLGNLVDEGIKVLNRAAEDAVGEATPIFMNAVKNITFDDAKNILLGNDDAATQYLNRSTSTELYGKFNVVIDTSFKKVGADKIWRTIITKYNDLPMTQDVNSDLVDYVTQEALQGVFTMIAMEEKEIRTKIASRTTDVLRKVFALQD